MKIVYSREFIKSTRLIPRPTQNKLAGLLEILGKDPFHPMLHAKLLSGDLRGFYSFRITRDWRVIFNFMENSQIIFLVDVAHRKDIYR